MERFAIKIDKNLRANLYKICRLCGIDNPDKVKVLDDATIVNLEEGEPELWKKVLDCIGLLITKDDKMPQFMCTLCVDKINDFFEFREMCYATDIQTRKLLGIKEEPKVKIPPQLAPAAECKVEAQDVKQPIPVAPASKPGRKRRNADMEICDTLKEANDIKDVKPSTATSLNPAKKKRLKLESPEVDKKPPVDKKPLVDKRGTTAPVDKKPVVDTKPVVQAKTGVVTKSGASPKLALGKKRLKIEPNLRSKKDLKPSKVAKLIKSKLKTEAPAKVEEPRRPTTFQLKKKKALELLKVKVEKMRIANIDAKIKEKPPIPAPVSGPNQPKVKLKEACSICSESFVNKTLLDKHIKTTHIPAIARYHCVHCNETLKKNMEIKNHNLWHKLSKTPFQCGNCSEASCSIYTYTKHIRDCGQVSYIESQVPDWHCPRCQGVFETTYLFNIHSCVSNTLVCPGCDRSHKWKEDYFKHIPTCAAAVHRIPSYMTPNIQVKNEAEHPNSPISPHHSLAPPPATAVPQAQTPQPSRITPPLMDSNQCVIIPANVGLLEEAPSSSPKGSCKKSNRITKKDLKRFDKLLKSTMTTLVSIKQEPTQCEGSEDREQSASVDVRASSESPGPSPEPADDHFYDDDESADEQSFPQRVGAIKQEIVDEGYRDLYSNVEVNVKRELPDNETKNTEGKRKCEETTGAALQTDYQAPKPVLKLKITKEHGTLNSILLDSPKSEKKKKKKKRKEDKHRDREDAENVNRGTTKTKAAVEASEQTDTEPTMPLPETVRVKEEIPDPEEEKEGSTDAFPSDAGHCVPSIVAATSGSLQISCVSEGVTFNGPEDSENHAEQESADVSDDKNPEMEATTQSSEPQEPVDIKPRLEDLIPTFQIASVTSGADVIKPPLKRKRGRPPGSTKATAAMPKILSVSSGNDVAPFAPELKEAPKPAEETCEIVDNNENVFDFTQVKVKEEIVDPAFEEQDAQVQQKELPDEVVETSAESQPICDKHTEESAYIANIDFNNLSIKQEKEYIDDGLDNPLGFEDDDDTETDTESSSDSDTDDSESDREYRELPSESEETTPNMTTKATMHPMCLQILDVRSEFSDLQTNEKTESGKAPPRGSEDTFKSNATTECKNLTIPDHRVVVEGSWRKEQERIDTNSMPQVVALEESSNAGVPAALGESTQVEVPAALKKFSQAEVPEALEGSSHIEVPANLKASPHSVVPEALGESSHEEIPAALKELSQAEVPEDLGESSHVDVPSSLTTSPHAVVPEALGDSSHEDVLPGHEESPHAEVPAALGESSYVGVPPGLKESPHTKFSASPKELSQAEVPEALGESSDLEVPAGLKESLYAVVPEVLKESPHPKVPAVLGESSHVGVPRGLKESPHAEVLAALGETSHSDPSEIELPSLNSERFLQPSLETKNECALRELSTEFERNLSADLSIATVSRANQCSEQPPLGEIDCNIPRQLGEIPASKEENAITSPTQRQCPGELGKSLVDHFAASFGDLNANPANTFGEDQVDLKCGDLSDLSHGELLQSITDHLRADDVNFTVMPVERTQADFTKPELEDFASTSKEDGHKPSNQSSFCNLTHEAGEVPEVGSSSASSVEDATTAKPSLAADTTAEDVAELTNIDLHNFSLSTANGDDLKRDNEVRLSTTEDLTIAPTPTPGSICQSSPPPAVDGEKLKSPNSNENADSETLETGQTAMFCSSSELLLPVPSSSAQGTVASQGLSLNEERIETSDEHFTQAPLPQELNHNERQAELIEPPSSDSLTMHMSNFGEAQPPNRQLFNPTIGLDSVFSAELQRQNLDANVSIDLSDVLSNTTLNAPSAVVVLSSACNVNDTSSNIPIYSSSLQHIGPDTHFMDSSLNFTDLCRNNSSLSSLSDFHISPPTGEHLHNLISPTDAHASQLTPELTEAGSPTANNPDLNVPVLNEEVQNLLNEESATTSTFDLNHSILTARCSSSSMNTFSPSAPAAVSVPNFTDLENVNEIAENNNNANIERELQDELGNALAAAIADRSPSDEVDDNNAMNENRANFDLT